MTTTEDGTRDVTLPKAVRFYAVAGGMHVPNLIPIQFARTREQRVAANDPRPSVAERYPDRRAYLRAYDAATAALVREGYLLAQDAPALHARAEELWASAIKEAL